MSLNCTLKNSSNGKFHVMYILTKIKIYIMIHVMIYSTKLFMYDKTPLTTSF